MAYVARLKGVHIRPKGARLDLDIPSGSLTCVVGAAASGKTLLLQIIGGAMQPAAGKVERPYQPAAASAPKPSRRQTPESLARRPGIPAQVLTETLSSLGLWETRKTPLDQLSPSQLAACECIEPMLSPAPLMLFDGVIERLDCYSGDFVRWLRAQARDGRSAVVATNRLDLIDKFDQVVVMRACEAIFVGSPLDLHRAHGEAQVTVESHRGEGVRALVDSFELVGTAEDGALRLTALEGQELAAGLLAKGYGDVRAVVTKRKSTAEVVISLLGGTRT